MISCDAFHLAVKVAGERSRSSSEDGGAELTPVQFVIQITFKG
jgi:hypothetical protein